MASLDSEPEINNSYLSKTSNPQYPHKDRYYDRVTSLLTSTVSRVISYKKNSPPHDKEIFNAAVTNGLNRVIK